MGWTADEVLDLGRLSAPRGMELYLPLGLSPRLRLTWRSALVGAGGGLAALLGASEVADLQVRITHHAFDSAVGTVASDVASRSHAALVVLALCTAVGAPVVEELAFRGLTYGAF